jgi:hypothetical protein
VKICYRCGIEKSRDEFHKNSKRADGLQTYCKSCKSAISAEIFKFDRVYRERQVAGNARNRRSNRKFVAAYKAEKGCVICGEDHPSALDLHHRDPSVKDAAVSEMVYGSKDRIMKEIDKCVVLCSNCHRKHHAGVKGFEI